MLLEVRARCFFENMNSKRLHTHNFSWRFELSQKEVDRRTTVLISCGYVFELISTSCFPSNCQPVTQNRLMVERVRFSFKIVFKKCCSKFEQDVFSKIATQNGRTGIFSVGPLNLVKRKQVDAQQC